MVLPPPNEARGVGDGPSELIDLKVRWLEQFDTAATAAVPGVVAYGVMKGVLAVGV